MRRTLTLVLAAVVLVASCSRQDRGPREREALRGDAVWLADGIGEGAMELEATLRSFRCAAAFVPARRLSGGPAGWAGSDLPGPPAPFRQVPVVLVIEAPADPLTGSTEEQQEALGAFLAREVASALARGAEFGPVAGVHLDVPFSAATVEPLASALREARSLLANELARKGDAASASARGVPLTLSLRGRPPSDEKEQDALRALVSRTDGLVAFVSGGDGAAPPAFTDSLGKPWWVAYDSRTIGAVRKSSGEPSGPVPESLLDSLTEDPRSEFRHELPWNVERGAAFTLQASGPIRLGSLSLAPGDSVAFVQPSLVELVSRLRAAPAGRNARGRVVVFGGTSDAGRVFPVAALADVLTGRPVAPVLQAWVHPGEDSRLLRVGAENASPHASAVSRVENWIEVDVAPAHLSDVEPGGFDRWEAYDAKGRLVSPGRASRLRFYETFVSPFERFEPARVRVRGGVPSPCCPVRVRVVPSGGGEVQTDWALPGAPAATPTP
jgi:hypothetical protein